MWIRKINSVLLISFLLLAGLHAEAEMVIAAGDSQFRPPYKATNEPEFHSNELFRPVNPQQGRILQDKPASEWRDQKQGYQQFRPLPPKRKSVIIIEREPALTWPPAYPVPAYPYPRMPY